MFGFTSGNSESALGTAHRTQLQFFSYKGLTGTWTRLTGGNSAWQTCIHKGRKDALFNTDLLHIRPAQGVEA
eukprot:358937-Chlamydomonas_euryale.AAC.4